MGTAPAFASVSEAIDMARAALCYLAAADAAQLPAETQADCLRGLECTDGVATAARASFLSAFTTGKGYSADADYSARAWLMHKTGITRGAAASHTAWANRYAAHPAVIAALAAGELSESWGRTICQWTDKLPEKFRDESDELLVKAAAAGLGLADLSALFAEMYQRARSDLPDEDPGRDFADRGVRLETTFQGAGVLNGDLTPECAAVVGKVLDALSAPAGAEDTRTQEQRYHDGLQEAMRRLVAARPATGAGRSAGQGLGAHLPGRPAPPGRQLRPAGAVDRAGPGRSGPHTARRVRDRQRRRGLARWRRRRGHCLRRRHGPHCDWGRQRRRSRGHDPAVRGTGLRGATARGTPAWAALEQAVIGKAVDLLSGPGGLAIVHAPATTRCSPGRAEPAAGHRVRRDRPGGHPQRGNAPGPALPVGRRVQPASLSL